VGAEGSDRDLVEVLS